MTIQNAVNQMLGSATIAAGLYAHSPAGKAAAKGRELKQKEKAENIKADIETGIAEESENPNAVTEVYASRARNIANIRKEQFENQPSEEGYRQYLAAKKEAETFNPEPSAVTEGASRAESRAETLSRQRNTVQFYDRFGDILGGGANG